MKAIVLNETIYNYAVKHCDLPHPALKDLISATQKLEWAVMQISPDQGAFMHLLTKLIGAKHVLEVGCYTGFSSICMALALPHDGKLITLDIDPDTTRIARDYFNKTDVANKIELRLNPAKKSLADIERDYGPESFDLMFIDADKENQWSYYESGTRLVRKNGLIIVDNVLWSGRVVDPNDSSAPTLAIKEFNEKIRSDSRVEKVMLPIADGLFFLRKL